MNVRTELDGKVLKVKLTGEVDMSTSGKVWDEMSPYIEGKKPKAGAAVVDLSEVGYMDSSGIATLVRAWQTMQKNGGKLKLAAPSASVKDVFELAHVNEIFDICDSVQEALAGL